MRRITCRKFATAIRSGTCSAIARNRAQEKGRQDFFAKREAFNITHRLAPTIYGFGSSTRWADHDEPYHCEPCATTDLSYPGNGRSSDGLNNPRWAAQCSKCGKKNPYYEKTEYEMLELTLPSAPTHTNWREMSLRRHLLHLPLRVMEVQLETKVLNHYVVDGAESGVGDSA